MIKKVCIVLLAVLGFTAKAQVPNSGFESLNSNNNTSFWGEVHLMQAWFDSLGVAHGDSIVYDDPGGRLYFPTTDAYQGVYALEMRNAFNYTSGYPMVGMARLSVDSNDYSAFVGSLVPVTQRPLDFSFYYKFTQAGPDTAVALVSVYDINAVEIGTCVVEIGDPASAYTYISRHIDYTAPDSAAYISIEFRTAKSGNATLGTRFLVDEVNMQLVGLKEIGNDRTLACYPVPAKDQLTIKLKGNSSEKASIRIMDITGKVVFEENKIAVNSSLQLNISELQSGMYFILVQDEKGTFTGKFSK